MCRARGLYILDPDAFPLTYGPDEQQDIAAMVDIIGPPLATADARKCQKLAAKPANGTPWNHWFDDYVDMLEQTATGNSQVNPLTNVAYPGSNWDAFRQHPSSEY